MVVTSPYNRDISALPPATKAFVLAYLSTTAPKALPLIIRILRQGKSSIESRDKLIRLLRDGFKLDGLPAFSAVIIGGSIAIQKPIYRIVNAIVSRIHTISHYFPQSRIILAARFLAAIISALIAFRLFNTQDTQAQSTTLNIQDAGSSASVLKRRPRRKSKVPPNIPQLPDGIESIPPRISASGRPLAGKSMDLTLFALTRAIDAVFQVSPVPKSPRWNRVWQKASKWSSPALFAASSALIMHAFFYSPRRLPFTYSSWIQRIAGVDERLVHALRQARYGHFLYGQETGIGPLLGSMAKDYNLPEEWGNPAVTIPVPCELVHHGAGPSCEYHALWRLMRGIKVALGVYAPLQAIMLLRKLSSRSINKRAAVLAAIRDALRSASFLGSFVALFYYGVCLSRTRLGPHLLGKDRVHRQMLDSGICVLGGCMTCGLSALVELPRRQTELMLFVAPKALGVFMLRRYPQEDQWKEQLAFVLSAAVVLTAAQQKSTHVRGVFGGILQKILA